MTFNDEEFRIAFEALIQKITILTQGSVQVVTKIPGLTLFRHSWPIEAICKVSGPRVCVVVQGSKDILLGDEKFVFSPPHYLLTAVHLPTISMITDASPARPYLSLSLSLDVQEVSKMVIDSNLPRPSARVTSGMAVGALSEPLLSAFKRLVDLLSSEDDVPILAPIIKREIIYRLLVGEQGQHLRQMVTVGSQSQQIAQTLDWLKIHFAEPVSVEDLAAKANMSLSTFNRHFRALTALSPLQYQKCLRLQESRRLMLTERVEVGSAAFRVGYESPSQFCREYARFFGTAPSRDIFRLRKTENQQAFFAEHVGIKQLHR